MLHVKCVVMQGRLNGGLFCIVKQSEASSPAKHDNGRAGVTARRTSPPTMQVTPVQSNDPNLSLPNSVTTPF